jgi:hypothetical protein
MVVAACLLISKDEHQQSVNKFCPASSKLHELCGDITLYSRYRLPFQAKPLATTSLLGPKNEHQQSINNFWACIMQYTRAMLRH